MLINSKGFHTALFTDTTTKNDYGLIQHPVSNVDAANSIVTCQTHKGGRRFFSKNISKRMKKLISRKNISNIYKRMRGRRNTRKTKRLLRRKYSRKHHHTSTCKQCKRGGGGRGRIRNVLQGQGQGQSGGTYQQFLSNVPLTQGYSIGGPLSKYDSALANGNIDRIYNECGKV